MCSLITFIYTRKNNYYNDDDDDDDSGDKSKY